MITELETTRLILKPLELADADQTQRLFPQWEVVQYLANVVPWPYPEDGAVSYYRNVALPAMARGDEWHWSIRRKTAPQELIGCIRLSKGETNRGFWLGIPWHGQGYMSEAADAITDFWFNNLGFSTIRISKAIANTASRRISEKSGMRVVAVEEKDYVGGRFPTEVWEITADEWRTYRAQNQSA